MATQERGEVPGRELSLQGSAQMSPLPGSPRCFPALVTCADPLGLCTVSDASGPQPFFMEDDFSMDQVGGNGFGMIQVHYTHYALYFYYHCIGSTRDH